MLALHDGWVQPRHFGSRLGNGEPPLVSFFRYTTVFPHSLGVLYGSVCQLPQRYRYEHCASTCAVVCRAQVLYSSTSTSTDNMARVSAAAVVCDALLTALTLLLYEYCTVPVLSLPPSVPKYTQLPANKAFQPGE